MNNPKPKKFRVKMLSRRSLALREFITIVDEDDASLLRSYYWYIINGTQSLSGKNNSYVARNTPNGVEYLHQVVVGAKPGELVQHINGNSLDNRKANLLKASNRVEEIE